MDTTTAQRQQTNWTRVIAITILACIAFSVFAWVRAMQQEGAPNPTFTTYGCDIYTTPQARLDCIAAS